eukprot:497408_1
MPISISLRRDDGKGANVSIARTILLTFRPIENSETSFAIRVDHDPCNNKLSNLEWNKCHKPNGNSNGGHMSAIELISPTKDTLHFKSIVACKAYFKSFGIDVSPATISKLCMDQSHKFGYKFLFSDQSKYQTHLPDLEGELWKLFGWTANGTEYWVSNKTRTKSVRTNGHAKLLNTNWQHGYLKISGSLSQSIVGGCSNLLHKIVAQCWVPNPNNYTMVDHIDTNTKNNDPSNLRWVENQRKNYENETSRKNKSIDIK